MRKVLLLVSVLSYLKKSLWFIIGFWLLWQFGGFFEIAFNVSAFYPVPALSIAFIALYGVKFAPVVFLAAITASYPPHGFWEYVPREWWQGLRQCLVYSLAGYSLRHILSCNIPLINTKDVISFLGITVLSSLLSALIAGSLFWAFDAFPVDIIPNITISFWTGDGAGIVMAFPLLMVLLVELHTKKAGEVIQNIFSQKLAFYGFTILLPMLFSIIGFGSSALEWYRQNLGGNLGYIILLPVVWLAAREGIIGGSLAALSANVTAAFVYAQIGHDDYSVVELQLLFALTSAFGILIGALTEKNRTEIEFRNQLLASTREGYTRDDAEGIIRDVNPAMCELIGLPWEDIVGKPFTNFMGLQDKDFIANKHMDHLQGNSDLYELTLLRPDGEKIPCLVNATPFLDDNGKPIGSIAMFTDISEIRKTQNELSRMGRLVAVNEMGSSILHEINSPIQTTSSTAYLALMDYENGKATVEGMAEGMRFVQDAMETISQVEVRIRRFMNGEPSKLEATDVNKTIKLAVELISAEARQHQVHLKLNLQPNLPQGMADTVELEQVFINLIKNACEAMKDVDPEDKNIDVRSELGGDSRIKVTVSDSGSGVAEEMRETIFEAFKTTKSGGTGMGLSICRNIMEGFGGAIEYFPNEINGSSFVLLIPVAKEEA